MAATKKQDIFDGEDVIVDDGITVTAEPEKEGYKGPMVSVFLPRLEEEGSLKVDQYEHVTIANEVEEKTYRVKRGERVDIPVTVYIILKQKYPDL
jgi:hypothetical protein